MLEISTGKMPHDCSWENLMEKASPVAFSQSFLRFPNKNSLTFRHGILTCLIAFAGGWLFTKIVTCHVTTIDCLLLQPSSQHTAPPSGQHCSQFPLYLHPSQCRLRGNPSDSWAAGWSQRWSRPSALSWEQMFGIGILTGWCQAILHLQHLD